MFGLKYGLMGGFGFILILFGAGFAGWMDPPEAVGSTNPELGIPMVIVGSLMCLRAFIVYMKEVYRS